MCVCLHISGTIGYVYIHDLEKIYAIFIIIRGFHF
jgi:hypothetical protein